MAIKKLFSIVVISIIALAATLFGRASFALAASPDTVTVEVSLQTSPTAQDISATTSVVFKKGTDELDTKLLAKVSENDNKIVFNPVTFDNIQPGSYEVCVVQTTICQNVQKGNDAVRVNLAGDLSAAQAEKMNTASAEDTEDKCYSGVGPLGWILCPIFGYIQKTITFIEKDVIVPFLEVPPLSVTNSDGSASTMYAIWQVFRGIANGLFVLVFLVIIFAQTSSIGIDSLTIKRMLPRLVAAAILVQFSYLICSLAIDITNILGRGIGELINGIINATGANTININSATAGIGLGALAVAALAFAGSVISGAILVTLLAAFFGVLGVFLTLVARQIIITILVILSPIAFILWVLPNTQNVFDFWRKNFTKILLMYPLIVLLFAASKVVALASTNTTSNGPTSAVSSLVGLAAAVAPLFLIPATFKFAGSLLIGAQGLANRLSGGLKGKAESTAQYEKLREWSGDRKKMLAAGVGVAMPGSGKKPVFGGKTSGKVGRVLGGGVLNASGDKYIKNQAARSRSIQELRALQAKKDKEMSDSGLDPDAYKMVHRGLGGADAMIADAWADVERKRLSGASTSEIGIAERKASDLEASKRLAARYFGSSAAGAAAAIKLGEFGLLDDDDRKLLAERSSSNTGQEYGKLIWKEARFKAGEKDPVVAGTTLDGQIDVVGIVKGLAARPPDKLSAISKDGWKKIASLGILDKIPEAKRQVLVEAGSNNPTSAAGVEIIEKYQRATQVAKRGRAEQSVFLDSNGRMAAHKYELLDDQALLGGLISDGSGNSTNERVIRVEVLNELADIDTKEKYVRRIAENKPIEAVSDDDWKSFDEYRRYWMSRVDGSGNKLDL